MRLEWDKFFMELAYLFSNQSTCDRKHVGCVIVRGKNVIACGYNGSISGTAHCDDVGHLIMEGMNGCQRTIHAEANAVAQAAKFGHPLNGCTAYITMEPCPTCFKLLASVGISRIVFHDKYNTNPTPAALLEGASMIIMKLDYAREVTSE